MRILALVPARGGSKRLPRKNLRSLGGKPLVAWSIEVCKGVADVCDILVSTDDAEIAAIAKGAGALVPWLRPAELSTDTVTTTDVALHALEWYESVHEAVDAVLLLQPTSPFRTRETVERGIGLFLSHGRPVIGVGPAAAHPLWCLKVEGETLKPFVDGGGLGLRSQQLPPAYATNGAFYLASTADLRRNRSFYRDDMVPLIVDSPKENIDIDTEFDWKVAEAFCE